MERPLKVPALDIPDGSGDGAEQAGQQADFGLSDPARLERPGVVLFFVPAHQASAGAHPLVFVSVDQLTDVAAHSFGVRFHEQGVVLEVFWRVNPTSFLPALSEANANESHPQHAEAAAFLGLAKYYSVGYSQLTDIFRPSEIRERTLTTTFRLPAAALTDKMKTSHQARRTIFIFPLQCVAQEERVEYM